MQDNNNNQCGQISCSSIRPCLHAGNKSNLVVMVGTIYHYKCNYAKKMEFWNAGIRLMDGLTRRQEGNMVVNWSPVLVLALMPVDHREYL